VSSAVGWVQLPEASGSIPQAIGSKLHIYNLHPVCVFGFGGTDRCFGRAYIPLSPFVGVPFLSPIDGTMQEPAQRAGF
jgi:hypothetical protein